VAADAIQPHTVIFLSKHKSRTPFSSVRQQSLWKQAMPAAVKRKPEVAFARGIGRMAKIFDEPDILRLLRAAVEREGNQAAFARRYGVERTSINLMLAHKRPVSEPIKNALGLRRTYTFSAPPPGASEALPANVGSERTNADPFEPAFYGAN
jgi:hypothetical protein